MRHEFTAIYEQDGGWIIAYCPEIPGANGQGRTKVEARDSLAGAIELCDLLRRMNFVERQHRGSHRIFTREGIVEILNLQARGGGQAKPYQVRQVRQLILKYTLAGEVPDGDSQ